MIIPEENKEDLKDIPKKILKQIRVIAVGHMDEVVTRAIILPEGETLLKDEDDSLLPPELVPGRDETVDRLRIN